MSEEGYGWASVSQWDMPPKDAIVKTKEVTTGLSKACCRSMLVNRVDVGKGYLRCEYVPQCAVTVEILRLAGNPT
jgi:hypothetical protein